MYKGFKKRRIAAALGMCLMLPSAMVHALGMGEIEVESALNEPLKAEIKLLSATKDELDTLEIALASNAAFARMGIDKLPALSSIEFELIREGAGAPFVKVYSKQSVREPFLDFILTVSWANGQLLREYTLLLDPPVFEEAEKPAPVAAAMTQPAEIVRPQPMAQPAPVTRVAAPGSYGPTNRNDTLWGVAKDMRPNRSVSVPQMMLGLLKENPEAFDKNNINNLKAGYVLRAPQMDAITALSKSQAAAETNRQYQEWLVSKGKAPASSLRQRVATSAPSDSAMGAPSPASSAAPSSEQTARLQLLTPDESELRSGVGSSVDGAGDGTVEQQLAIALETSEAAKQENADLRARLADLEKQLQDIQRLISLKDDTLVALQAGSLIEEAAKPEETAQQEVAEVKKEEAQPEKPKPAPKPRPVVQPEPVETSLIDDLLADPKLLALALGVPLVLILGAVSFLRKRRQAAEEEFDISESLAEAEPEESTAEAPAASTEGAAETAPEDSFGETVSDSGFGGFGGAGVSSIHAEESEIDPIAEADVYLAYRRYEQAEALLKEAIRADNGRNELKLKLLEIYSTSKNKDAFEAQAEALYAALGSDDAALWSQAVEMGRELCPDHPLFSDDTAMPAADSGDATDTDLSKSLGDDVGLDFESDEAAKNAETDLDFSDEALASSLDLPGAEASGASAESELDFDLNSDADEGLDLGDDLEAASTAEAEAPEAELDNTLDLDAGMADVDLDVASELEDLDAELEGLGDLNEEMADLSDALEPESEVAEYDTSSESESGPDWEIDAAISTFDSRDVKTESDDGYVPDVSGVKKEAIEDHDLDHLELEASDESSESALDDLGDLELPEQLVSADDEEEGNIFDNSDDVVGTKLDLAKAYIDMGDNDGARVILDEVSKEGDDDQRQEAEQLISQIS